MWSREKPGHRTDVSSVGNAKKNHAEEVRRADKQSKGIVKQGFEKVWQ